MPAAAQYYPPAYPGYPPAVPQGPGYGDDDGDGFAQARAGGGIVSTVDPLATVDPTARDALYTEATRLAMPQLPIIPLHFQVNVWAIRKGLTFHQRSYEGTRAWDIEPQFIQPIAKMAQG